MFKGFIVKHTNYNPQTLVKPNQYLIGRVKKHKLRKQLFDFCTDI